MSSTTDTKRPDWWNFDEDGDTIAGALVLLGQGHTAQGDRPFLVLDVDGVGQRTLWLHQTVLYGAFRREVQARPDHQLHVGERIEVTRLGARESKEGGRSYIDYRVSFGDAYQPSQADIFDIDQSPAEPAAGASQEEEPDEDPDIPF